MASKKGKKTEAITPTESDHMMGMAGLKYPAKYMAFVNWIAVPEPYRQMKQQKEFAEAIGVNEDTLTDWKRRDGFWEEVRRVGREFLRERTPNAMAAMYKRILEQGTAQEVRLWLEYVEGWKSDQPNGGRTQYEQIPDEEYVLIKRVFNKNIDRKVPKAR